MKISSKFLLLFILVLASCYSEMVNAQSARKFSLGLNVGHSPNTRHVGLAIGGDVRYQFNVTKHLSIPLTAGFTSIKYKDRVFFGTTLKGGSRQYYPLKLGIKGNFNKTGLGLYGLLEGGIVVNLIGLKGGSGIPTVFSTAIGYALKNRIDLAIKLEDYTFNGFIGIRAAYAF